MLGLGAAAGQALAKGGVGRGLSGNEFWDLVSIIYGTWYLVLCFWLMVIGKGYVVRADGGR